MPTYTFQELKNSDRVKISCSKCGKKLIRTVSVTQTINPFNRIKDGQVKTREIIHQELRERLPIKIKELQEKGVVCRKCEAV